MKYYLGEIVYIFDKEYKIILERIIKLTGYGEQFISAVTDDYDEDKWSDEVPIKKDRKGCYLTRDYFGKDVIVSKHREKVIPYFYKNKGE